MQDMVMDKNENMTETLKAEEVQSSGIEKNGVRKIGLVEKLIPFFFGISVFLLDQLTKMLVIKNIPYRTVYASFFGDLLRIIHVRNLGAAFSMGGGLPEGLRTLLLSIIPVVILLLVMGVYFRSKTFTWFQCWMICGVTGGGFGNLYDRIYRAEGVVDFIDVKFFGLFGMERFPTFNIADSFIMVCGILLMISFFLQTKRESKKSAGTENSTQNNQEKKE